jgi:hypothetical protein
MERIVESGVQMGGGNEVIDCSSIRRGAGLKPSVDDPRQARYSRKERELKK